MGPVGVDALGVGQWLDRACWRAGQVLADDLLQCPSRDAQHVAEVDHRQTGPATRGPPLLSHAYAFVRLTRIRLAASSTVNRSGRPAALTLLEAEVHNGMTEYHRYNENPEHPCGALN